MKFIHHSLSLSGPEKIDSEKEKMLEREEKEEEEIRDKYYQILAARASESKCRRLRVFHLVYDHLTM